MPNGPLRKPFVAVHGRTQKNAHRREPRQKPAAQSPFSAGPALGSAVYRRKTSPNGPHIPCPHRLGRALQLPLYNQPSKPARTASKVGRPEAVFRRHLPQDLGCTQTIFTRVLSPFGSQKTSDLGLSRRGLFEDVLVWSGGGFSKKNQQTYFPEAGRKPEAGGCRNPGIKKVAGALASRASPLGSWPIMPPPC